MLRSLFVYFMVTVATLVFTPLYFLTLPLALRYRHFDFCWHQWARVWLWSAGVRVRIEGGEHLPGPGDPPVIMMSNHRSILDTPVMIVVTKGHMRFVVKSEAKFYPLVGQIALFTGFVWVHRNSARKSLLELTKMVERLRAGGPSVCVFPEGTRSPDGKLGPFRKGIFKMVKRAGVPLLPYVIKGSADRMPRGTLRVRPGEITVRFRKAFGPEEIAGMTRDELHDRVRAHILSEVPEQTPEGERVETARPQGPLVPAEPAKPTESPAS